MRNRSASAFAAGLLVAGCASTPPTEVREELDERTGVTVTSMHAPLEFYSQTEERGLEAASFAYLAPLEINRMGQRDTYLWLSVVRGAERASDDDRPPPGPPQLRIAVDGATLEPAFVGAQARELGLGEVVYERPAHWVGESFYAITPQQIAQMAAANGLAVEIAYPDEEARRYDLSKMELAGLRAFSERIGVEAP
jgi:hypothetical protein